MSKVSIATLKSYFEDGQEPDENKYIDLIDTLKVEPYNNLHTAWMNFPGIVALWNSHYSRQTTSQSLNMLPTSLPLIHSGGLTRNRYYGVPTWAFASALNRRLDRQVDDIALSFTGTEGNVTTTDRGFCVGGWFFFSDGGNWDTASQGLISKWGAGGNLGYLLQMHHSKKIYIHASSNGTAYASKYIDTELSPLKFYFIAGGFRTSTGVLTLFINGTYQEVGSGYSSIFDSSEPFRVGTYGNPIVGFLDGRVSGIFAAGMYVPGTILDRYYQQTKAIFEEQGVLGDPP